MKKNIKITAVIISFIVFVLAGYCFFYFKNKSFNNVFLTRQGNQIEDYENKLDKINNYQEKYFEIIKRNDAFLDVEGNFNTKKDLEELKALFDEVKNKIDKNIDFYNKYEDIVSDYRQNTGNTTFEMNEFATDKYNAVDKLLNEIYKELKSELSQSEFENLRFSQRQWLKDVEEYDKVFKSKEFGTIGTLIKLDYETNMRSFRSLLLMLYLKNDDSVKLSDYLGEWNEVYAGRIYLNIENDKDKIKVIYGGANSAYSHSETVYDCIYDNNKNLIKCFSAKHTDKFETCKGTNTQDDMDEFLECSKKYPNEVKDDYKIYSDNKEKILLMKKGNDNYFVVDDDKDMPEDKKAEIKENYKNMKIYFKDDKDLVFYKYKK